MTWARFDDGFYAHPKLARLGHLQLPAVGLNTLACCWSASQLTDGHIPRAQVFKLAGDLEMLLQDGTPWEIVDALLDSGLWEECQEHEDRYARDKAPCYVIHDYLDYNPSREQVLAERQAKAEAGRAGASARWSEAAPKAVPMAPAKPRAKAPAMAAAMTPPMAERVAERWQNDAPVPVPVPQPRARALGEKPVANAPGSPGDNSRSPQDHGEGASSTQTGGRAQAVKHPNSTGPELESVLRSNGAGLGPAAGEIVREPTAQELTGEFVDLCRELGQEPVPRVIGHEARELKALLDAGKRGDLIRQAMRRQVDLNRSPESLAYLIGELERERNGHGAMNGRAARNARLIREAASL